MKIRQATKTDAQHIVSFQLKMAKETENFDLPIDVVSKGVDAVFDDKNKGIYYVAEHDNKIIASLLTTYEWSDWRNGTILWIQSVYVLKEFRKKGVFTKMYDHIKNKVDNDNSLKGIRLYVEKNNSTAQMVYEKCGMTAEHYDTYEWLK